MIHFVIPFIWAIAHRCGGGLVKLKFGGSFLFRSLIPALLITWLYPQEGVNLVYEVILLSGGFFIGEAAYGYSKWWWLGRKDNSFWYDFGMMTLRGLVMTLFAGIGLCFFTVQSGIILALSGLCMGAAYEIGWRIPLKIKEFTQGPELGEVVFGFLLGLINYLFYLTIFS